jgi:hypothetical protein
VTINGPPNLRKLEIDNNPWAGEIKSTVQQQ